MTAAAERYVAAAGRFAPTWLYDHAMRLTMRERIWRPRLAAAVTGGGVNDVLEVGCGTGSLLVELARAAPHARLAGIDGDAAALARARTKLAGHERVELKEALADAVPFGDASFDRVTCSLLLHHLTPAGQRRALAEAARVLRPGGELHVADWGPPRGLALRATFLALRLLDGVENTRPHARGELPALVAGAGLRDVHTWARVRTAWGTLELLRATR